MSRSRSRRRLFNPLTSPRATGDGDRDRDNLELAFDRAAQWGDEAHPHGRFLIATPQDVWFYWNNYLPAPVYGAVPIFDDLMVDASEAIFTMRRDSWMGNQTRLALFYSPGFTTAQGRYSNIQWRGGTFDFTRTGVNFTPSLTNAFGFIGVDDYSIENVSYIGATGERVGRGGFFQNCRNVRHDKHMFENVAQGRYFGFVFGADIRGDDFRYTSEPFDIDHTCDGLEVINTRAKTCSQQVWDAANLTNSVFLGLVADDIRCVFQGYGKTSGWQSFQEWWDHLAEFNFTVDTAANTITLGSVASEFGAANPVLADGRRFEFNPRNNGGTLPTPTTRNALYYLVNTVGNTFQIATTEGGAPLDLSGTSDANNVILFHCPNFRVMKNVTVAHVKATNMNNDQAIASLGLQRSSSNCWLQDQEQVRDVTFFDWDCDGGSLMLVNEGLGIVLERIRLRNCRPPRDKNTGYALVARISQTGGISTEQSELGITIRDFEVLGCEQGGAIVSGATDLIIEGLKIEDFVGETWSDGSGTYDTRLGLGVVRSGSKAGTILHMDNVSVSGGPDNCKDFLFDDANSPGGDYQLYFSRFNLASQLTATGVTPADIRITNDEARDALMRNLTVAFDETVDTTTATKTKFAASDPSVYLKVLACSVKTLAAIASGSGSNGSTLKLTRRVAGVENDITNGTLRLDPDAGVAADAERYMPMTSNPSNATIAPGETLVAKIVAAGTGGTSPPCAANIVLFKYTSV